MVRFHGFTTRKIVGATSKEEIKAILLFEEVEGGDLLKYLQNYGPINPKK